MSARPKPANAIPKMSAGGRVGLIGSRTTPKPNQRPMRTANGMFCPKIQCHDRCSTYHPSRDAAMLSESSKFNAYNASANAQNFGGEFGKMKLNVSGMKKPDARPLAN